MTTTQEENAALVRRFLTDIVAGRDIDAFDAFVTDDVVTHDLVFGDGPGDDGVHAMGKAVLATVTDIDVAIEETIAEDDLVAVRATLSGTHNSSLLDLAPPSISFEIAHVWFYRIDDGRIAEAWLLPDGLDLVQQLGMLSEEYATRSPHN